MWTAQDDALATYAAKMSAADVALDAQFSRRRKFVLEGLQRAFALGRAAEMPRVLTAAAMLAEASTGWFWCAMDGRRDARRAALRDEAERKQLALSNLRQATVAINDLEARGLVIRETDPQNRRCKLVSLTDAGRAVVAVLDDTEDPAPAPLAALDAKDLQMLQAILTRIVS